MNWWLKLAFLLSIFCLLAYLEENKYMSNEIMNFEMINKLQVWCNMITYFYRKKNVLFQKQYSGIILLLPDIFILPQKFISEFSLYFITLQNAKTFCINAHNVNLPQTYVIKTTSFYWNGLTCCHLPQTWWNSEDSFRNFTGLLKV